MAHKDLPDRALDDLDHALALDSKLAEAWSRREMPATGRRLDAKSRVAVSGGERPARCKISPRENGRRKAIGRLNFTIDHECEKSVEMRGGLTLLSLAAVNLPILHTPKLEEKEQLGANYFPSIRFYTDCFFRSHDDLCQRCRQKADATIVCIPCESALAKRAISALKYLIRTVKPKRAGASPGRAVSTQNRWRTKRTDASRVRVQNRGPLV
jgi:hypothetical protein